MSDLTELLVNEKGLIDLKGLVVNAIPVGQPLIFSLLIKEEKDKRAILAELLLYKPKNANAYVLGEGLDKNHFLVQVTQDLEGRYKAYAVQYYKLNHT